MKSRLIASVMAAAVALTSVTASPVSANDDIKTRNLVLGLSALAILGAVASQNNNQVDRRDNRWDDSRNRDWDNGRRHDDRWRNSLPSACEFRVRTRDGSQQVLGANCLQQHRVAVNRLPNQCEMNIRTNHGTREVFGSRCLERKGYRIEARR